MIRPADRVIIAVAGAGAGVLAAGAREASARVLAMFPENTHQLGQSLAGDPAHSGCVTVVPDPSLTTMRYLVHHGAHAVLCPPADALHLYDGYADPLWVWENHAATGAALARQARRYLDSGLATTFNLKAAL